MKRPVRLNHILLTVILFLLAVNLVIGTLIMQKVWAQQETALGKDDSIKLFSEVFSIIKSSYVEPIESDELIESAISGITSELDPHSSYLDPDRFKALQEDQREQYGGLGIIISMRNGFLTVISPIEQSPASKLGIRAGDIIVEIEGESTKDMDINDAVKKLKGKPGTTVDIKVKKKGHATALPYTIERAIIKIKSVPYYFKLKDHPETGYIKITGFAQETQKELLQAIKDLNKDGMKQLILDLRSNPGGLLDQAVAVSQLFLQNDLLIVYTKGRTRDSNQEFYSESKSPHFDMPLVVLINEGSASGSEIVAGAIQDYDRGLLIGMPTFGKGLVQTLFTLEEGKTALALTTARYYTPAGRCIQKPFIKKQGVFAYSDGTPYGFTQSDDEEVQEQKITATKGGREIISNGGINPDLTVEPDRHSLVSAKLERNAAYFEFAVKFLTKNKRVSKNIEITDDIIQQFLAFVRSKEIDVDEAEFREELDMQKLLIKREILTSAFDLKTGTEFFINHDRQVLEAVERFTEAKELLPLYLQNVKQVKDKTES